MIFIESYQSIAIAERIDRELQVVVQPDATVADDVRIAQNHNSAQTIRIVDQQCAILISNVRDRSGRSSRVLFNVGITDRTLPGVSSAGCTTRES